MKILLATSRISHVGGGIASYNEELINLYDKENEIYILSDVPETEKIGCIDVFSTAGHSNSDPDYAERLVDKINSFGYDLIINSNSSFIPVIVKYIQVPVISVSHFVDGPLAINAGFNARFQSSIVALSEYGKQFIIDTFNPSDPASIKVIYNFVADKKILSPLEKSENWPIRIVYPGGTSVAKSVDVVQRLVYRLLSSDLDFEFVWLGGDRLPSANSSLLGLKDTKSLFKNDKRLIITGLVSRDQAVEYIESANIFLLPSRGEGCPMTLLEAMRAGCIPIVSDSKHGSKEIIEHSKVGIIVPQDSSSALFDAIKEIIDNPNNFACCYTDSRKYLSKELSQRVWNEKMIALIEEAIKINKLYIPFAKKDFIESAHSFNKLIRKERIKTMFRSAICRMNLEGAYIKNCLGLYKYL